MKYRVLFIIFILMAYGMNLSGKNWFISPENPDAYVDLIRSNLKQGKKYIAKENSVLLKKIIAGIWDGGFWGSIDLKKNKSYIREFLGNSEVIRLRGKWKLDGHFLLLKENHSTKYEKYEIKYFKYDKMKPLPFGKRKDRYYFHIIFINPDSLVNESLGQFYMQFEKIDKASNKNQ